MPDITSRQNTLKQTLTDLNDLSLHDAAGEYVRRGFAVFPLQSRDKKPLGGSHGCKDASTDIEAVLALWRANPNANVGVATGNPSGIFVLDVDGPVGEQTLSALIEQYGPLSETAQATTGNGRHYHFKDPGGLSNSARKLGPGLDIRADGGYVVAPPSIHANGRPYLWTNDLPPADAPEWLVALARAGAHSSLKSGALPAVTNHKQLQFERGSRNSSLASLAGTLLQKGLPRDAIEGLLQEANASACTPPLPEREVSTVAASICRYPVRNSFGLTDLGNAQRFAELYREEIVYVPQLGHWLRWVGSHWRRADDTEVLSRAYVIPELIRAEATQHDDKAFAKKLGEHSFRSEARGKLEAMVKLAQSYCAIEDTLLDRDPMLLPVANGTLDLRNGSLREHARSDYLTRCVEIEFHAAAEAPRWKVFLHEITNGDRDLQAFLQCVVGHLLTGDTREQCLFILHGHGANGKSTFVEVISTLLGAYAIKTPMTTFVQPKGERSSNDLARMRGARLVSASEVSHDATLNVSLVKELTGQDKISCRYLYGEFFEYPPQFKIVVTVNELPEIKGGCDEAIKRRLCVIPFRATFANEARDNMLMQKLKEELPGILAWAVEGCLRWQAEGLRRPSAVTSATAAYHSQIDALGEFLAAATKPDKEARVPVRQFMTTFNKWLDATGHETMNPRAIGGLMNKKGYPSLSRGGLRVYSGLTLTGSFGGV